MVISFHILAAIVMTIKLICIGIKRHTEYNLGARGSCNSDVVKTAQPSLGQDEKEAAQALVRMPHRRGSCVLIA